MAVGRRRRPLTRRQAEVLERLTRPGASIKYVASEMGLTESTVKNHLSRIYRDLDVSTAAQAARIVYGPRR